MKIIEKLRFISLAGFIFLGLIAIVGSNGDGVESGEGTVPTSTQDSTDKIFTLNDPNFCEPGDKISITLSGNDSSGGQYTANYYLKLFDETTLDGQTVYPEEELLVLTDTATGASASSHATCYYTEDDEPVQIVSHTTGRVYEPTNISIPPETAEIGDFGALTSWEGSDGSTRTGTWVLEEASGGLANLVQNTTKKDSSGDVEGTTQMTRTIDENGSTQSVAMTLYLVDLNSTLSLSSTEITYRDFHFSYHVEKQIKGLLLNTW